MNRKNNHLKMSGCIQYVINQMRAIDEQIV